SWFGSGVQKPHCCRSPEPLLIQVSKVLRAMIVVAALFSGEDGQVADDDDRPLTESLGNFSERAVPFTATTWSCVAVLFLFLVAHELHAVRAKPLLAGTQKANTLVFQISSLIFFFSGYLMESLLLPISLDFAKSMGQSATMSGFFISASLIACLLGIAVGKRLVSESSWDQNRARTFIIGAQAASSLVLLVQAVVSNATVGCTFETKRAAFWLIIGLAEIYTFIATLPLMPLMVMWSKFTPNSDKSFWMIWTQCARNGGFLIGPGVFAVLSVLVGQSRPVAPVSLLAWVFLLQCVIVLLATIFIAMALPVAVPPTEEAQEEELDSDEASPGVDQLHTKQREQVVKGMVRYAFERQYQAASIEVSTVMLLEASYAWSIETSGAAITVVSLTSLLLAAFSAMLMSRRLVSESVLFFAANLIALLGVVFLFDFGTGAAGLLLA
ncbi:unnamed protein product, partial [Effrenium voratum]